MKKIRAKVADMAKFQYNVFQKIVWEKHNSEIDAFDFVEDWLDVFLGKYISDKKELWHICKLVFVLSHGQSYVEHGFSVNKELIDTNMKEKSLVARRLFYDKLISEDSKCYKESSIYDVHTEGGGGSRKKGVKCGQMWMLKGGHGGLH